MDTSAIISAEFRSRRIFPCGPAILLILLTAYMGCSKDSTSPNTPSPDGDCEWCERDIEVYAISWTEPFFTSEEMTPWIASLLDGPCVRIRPFGSGKPEYVISMRYERSEDGKFWWLDKTGTWGPYKIEDGKTARSAFTAALFFVGGYPEFRENFNLYPLDIMGFVNYTGTVWTMLDPNMSLEGLKAAIAPMIRASRPLKDILRDFEQTPVSCTVTPAKDTVAPGEEIEIRVTGFKDFKGRTPEINIVNRILAKAEQGEILSLDCVTALSDPKLKVWAYDMGTKDLITIKYKAPDKTCVDDVIKVWNSCDVKGDPPNPMNNTGFRDVIGQATVKTACYSAWSGTVNYTRTISWTDREPITDGYVEYTRQLSESASIKLAFGYSHVYISSDRTDEYYDKELTAEGTYSATVKIIDHIVDEKDGVWTKIEETASGGGNLEHVGGFLMVNSDTGTYSLHLDFASPYCIGTRVTTSSGGARFEEEYTYMINGYGVDFEGKVSKGSFSDSWSLPAGKNPVITESGGKVPGATFNWSFGR